MLQKNGCMQIKKVTYNAIDHFVPDKNNEYWYCQGLPEKIEE